MRYMGGKSRIAKKILPLILANREAGQAFYDVCCGGANIIDKVSESPKFAVDNDLYLIAALELIRDNPSFLPKSKAEISESDYKYVRDNPQLVDRGVRGYYGYALSYGAKWFGGWSRDRQGNRDHVAEAYRNAQKQSPKLQNVTFICADFDKVNYLPNSIIYLDPPYFGTTKYKNAFPHHYFWKWCREMSEQGHQVFVSEYQAPSPFVSIWSKEIASSLTQNTGHKKGIEQLFTIVR